MFTHLTAQDSTRRPRQGCSRRTKRCARSKHPPTDRRGMTSDGPSTQQNCSCSVANSFPTLCDPRGCSTPGFPVLGYLPKFAQIHICKSVIPSNHLILCRPLLLLPSVFSAAAKSLQSCLTLCDPIDGSPPGSTIPGILQARTLEWVAIAFSKA